MSSTLFAFPSARITKHIPNHTQPTRINGYVEQDAIGVGRLPNPSSPNAESAILLDISGPLSLSSVPDALSPQSTSHLVLSLTPNLESAPAHHAHHGAARTHVLPFRACPTSKNHSVSDPTSSSVRPTYPGLGAGKNGQDGGSFWFFEDESEQGAKDRLEWESRGVGKRAIWTVWLIGAPSPLLIHLQQLLALYPNPLPPLPPFLREPSSYPWRDVYSIKNPPQPQEAIDSTPSPTSPVSPSTASRRALPPIPTKPSRFRSPPTSPQSSIDVQARPLPIRDLSDEVAIPKMGMSALPSPSDKEVTQGESFNLVTAAASRVNKNDEIKEQTDDVNSQVGTTPFLDLAAASDSHNDPDAGRAFNIQEDLRTESPLTRMANVEKSSENEESREVSEVQEQDDLPPMGPAETMRSFSRSTLSRRIRPPSDYRHSLVAVDNETGKIVSILAENVQLTGPKSPAEEEEGLDEEAEVDSSSSEDSEERGNDPLTPADEPNISLASIGQPDDIKSEEAVEEEEEEDATFVKPASVIRPVTSYRDLDADRPPSRAASILREETFAPPPLPFKNNRESIRSSMASAQFFSAAEDEEDLENGEDEEDARANREMLAGFTSIDNGLHESHRPDLLRDLKNGDDDDDDDARSDASGSTVGGPAIKFWRKVKGQKKNGKGKKEGQDDEAQVVTYGNVAPTRRENRAEPSSESVRTSRAETALEGDDEEEDIEDTTATPSKMNKRQSVHSLSADPLQGETQVEGVQEPEQEMEEDQEVQHDRIPTSATVKAVRLHGHRTRALLRTEEIRSAEDGVWRDAFEAESLPADAPYTHLAARGLSQYGTIVPASANAPIPGKEREQREQMELSNEEDDGSIGGEMELLAPDEARRARKLGIKPKAKGVKKRKNTGAYDYMQGGTVLVEFLAGSRLGASIIKAGDSALKMAVEPPTNESESGKTSSSEKTSDLRKGAMAYVPVLPAHLLWWFGISDEASEAPVAANPSTASAIAHRDDSASSLVPGLPLAQISSASTAFLEDFGKSMWGGVSDISEGLSSWFGFSKSAAEPQEPSAQAVVDRMLAGDEDAQDWEYVVPDFDPNSLASTPRPVYRRKKPVPSMQAGFDVRSDTEKAQDSAPLSPTSDQLSNSTPKPQTSYSSSRYSIIHIDGDGYGRRAFLRGPMNQGVQ